jgi:hypothetical protein
MRKYFIVLSLLISCLTFCQTDDKSLDPKLFGTWNGSEKDQQVKGISKSWIMHRFEDGSFVLLFTAVENGEVSNFAEKGKWWIDKNGAFNELHFDSGKTDIYSYIMLDNNNVKFKAKLLSLDHENQEYEFIDTKLDDGL